MVCDRQTAELVAADPRLAARSLGAQTVKSLGEVEIFTVALAEQVVAGDQASR